MTSDLAPPQEIDIYSGFGEIPRGLLMAWKKHIVAFSDESLTRTIMQDMNRRLRLNNVIVFFDHHYAFDAVPVALALERYVESLRGVLIPYAVHLDMGVGRKGEFSLRYKLRTLAFHWLARNIIAENPFIQFLPVAREFEMDAPRLRKIVNREYKGVNTRYLKTFVRNFSKHDAGQACFLTPFSGIGFPGKAVLHPQLYRSIKLVQMKCKRDISFYLVGAYPSWHAHRHYLAPLMAKHTLVMSGPFSLPVVDYEDSKSLIASKLNQIRTQANFNPPEYDRLLMK